MKFDRTFIAIRERSTLGIFDLALRVLVDHFRPIAILWLINVTPWLLLDFWLIGWMIDPETPLEYRGLFVWAMTMLVVSQAQVGTFLISQYLGKAMFEGRPTIRTVLKSSFSAYFLVAHGLLRTVAITIGLCLLVGPNSSSDAIFPVFVFFLPLSVLVGVVVRAFRTYISEILLLERTPIRASGDSINFSTRSRSLHSFASNDLIGKAITGGFLTLLLAMSVHGFLVVADGVMNIRANNDYSLQPYYWTVSMWLVAGYCGVVRFLAYIDLRIRQEGWAVELRMRAESQRLEELLE